MNPTRFPPHVFVRGFGALALGLALLAGCATHSYQAQPLSPDATAAALSARSLQDDGLRAFLTKNLGHEPAPWPLPAWDFETLTWVAFYYRPPLEVARAQWDAARAAQQTAGARANPTLTVTPGYDVNSGGASPWFPSVSLDFLLPTAGKRRHRVDIEKFSAEAARLNVFAAAWQVRGELRQALLAQAVAERRHVLLRDRAEVQRQLAALLAQRLAAGAATTSEVSAARTTLMKAEADDDEAQQQVALARLRVAQALGLPPAALDGIRLADPLAAPAPAPTGEELAAARRLSLQTRADVLGALARYEATQSSLQLEIARQYPDLTLGPGYQYDLGENKWSLALSVELPVFDRNDGPIAAAEAHRREAAAAFLATQAQAIAAIDGAAAARASASAQLASARRLHAELQQQASRAQARLAAGAADRAELLNARLEVAMAAQSLFEGEVAAAQAAGQLEDALQVPFRNSTAVVDAPRNTAQSRTP